jgi:hypothetical protein
VTGTDVMNTLILVAVVAFMAMSFHAMLKKP